MPNVFLGKPVHWGLMVFVAGLLWWAGVLRSHVIYFNWFLIALCFGSVVIVLLVLKTTKPGEQVTRDPLPQPGESDAEVPAGD